MDIKDAARYRHRTFGATSGTARIRALLLLLIIVLQTVGMAGPWTVAAVSEEVEHQLMHAQDDRHHHHDDQSLHIGDAQGDLQHQHVDTGLQPAGLISNHGFAFADATPASPAEAIEKSRPAPWLEGPRRPPRHATPPERAATRPFTGAQSNVIYRKIKVAPLRHATAMTAARKAHMTLRRRLVLPTGSCCFTTASHQPCG